MVGHIDGLSCDPSAPPGTHRGSNQGEHHLPIPCLGFSSKMQETTWEGCSEDVRRWTQGVQDGLSSVPYRGPTTKDVGLCSPEESPVWLRDYMGKCQAPLGGTCIDEGLPKASTTLRSHPHFLPYMKLPIPQLTRSPSARHTRPRGH